MEWFLFKIADQVAKPSNMLFAGMAASFLVALIFRRRWALWLAALGMAGYAAISVVPVGEWLLIPLEDRFPVPEAPPERVDGILVVSPRIAGEIARARGRLQGASEELSALIELGRRYPEAEIVLVGIGESTSAATMKQTKWVRAFLEGQGFDADRVVFADEARSNHLDMFRLAHEKAEPAPEERWLLVQAAAEIPRAMGVARRLGWELEPWPVGFRTTGEAPPLAPHIRPTYYLFLFDVAVREYGLMSIYHARGWTSDLFPGPNGSAPTNGAGPNSAGPGAEAAP